MTEPIISKDMIRAKARAAHARGVGRDGHGFNWHSETAIAVWQDEWDWCEQNVARQAQVVLAEAN